MNITIHPLQLKFNPLTQEGVHDVLQFVADCPTSAVQLVDFGVCTCIVYGYYKIATVFYFERRMHFTI